MKKQFVILLVCLGLFTMNGCSEVDSQNRGIYSLQEIGNGLYYDVNTKIVYWWNDSFSGNSSTTPTSYYAPNGLPYKYNPETNTLEEIPWGDGLENNPDN